MAGTILGARGVMSGKQALAHVGERCQSAPLRSKYIATLRGAGQGLVSEEGDRQTRPS